jgi:hypothetical protein
VHYPELADDPTAISRAACYRRTLNLGRKFRSENPRSEKLRYKTREGDGLARSGSRPSVGPLTARARAGVCNYLSSESTAVTWQLDRREAERRFRSWVTPRQKMVHQGSEGVRV